MKVKLCFAIVLTTFCFRGHAQREPYAYREANKNSKIALAELLGDWYTSDSTRSTITFVLNVNLDVSLEGKRDGVNDYRFALYKDSVFVNGLAPNWPPYYCTLFLKSEAVLEVLYYQFLSQTIDRIIYKRESSE